MNKDEDRGMQKWQPFYSVLSKKEIDDNINVNNHKEMPILSEDQINENEEIIKNAYECKIQISAIIYENKNFKEITGLITKIDPYNKTIYINNKAISFKYIYKIKDIN